MKQEEKELLLKDLCARLPYRVKGTVTYRNGVGKIYNVVKYINGKIYDKFSEKSGIWYDNIVIKPYLFPLSSMTEEQIAQIEFWAFMKEYHKITDFYYENHIDFRGLIEKGLALDVTNLNIY